MDALRFALHLEPLDPRVVPAAPVWPSDIWQAVGADDGGPPTVHLLQRNTNRETEFLAYDPAFRGGVRTALGDVTGDGVPDVVTAAGVGGGPHVKVFDGKTGAVVRNFFAYDVKFTGGVEVAVADVNRDGAMDIITGAGAGGGPHVMVFSGRTGAELFSFFAYSPTFGGGVYVAGGDVNRDGYADIITGSGVGASPLVRVLDGRTGAELNSFNAFDTRFTGGARVASGDLNADGIDDLIVAAGPGGGPHVKAFDGRTGATLFNRFVADAAFRGGVRLAVADHVEDGQDNIITRTRTGDVVETQTFSQSNGWAWPQSVWVGDGSPPADTILSASLRIPPIPISPIASRTVEGPITAIAADGKSMTVRRGDGTPITMDLAGTIPEPLPNGEQIIDGYFLSPAAFFLGDAEVGVGQLHVGRWVRVEVDNERADGTPADPFYAMRVQLL